MLAATLAINGFISMEVTQDWATHDIGHELTALHGIPHGASLAIVLPGTMRVMKDQKRGKLLQYAQRVFGIEEGPEEERIEQVIARTEEFFHSLGLATHLSDANIPEEIIATISERFKESGVALGERGNITGEVVRQILSIQR